jgi:hypothetical protein
MLRENKDLGPVLQRKRGQRRGELIHGRRSDKFWLGWANENVTDFPTYLLKSPV